MPSIQELGEVHGAARRPGLGLVQVDEERGHHVVLAKGPEEPLAVLGVVVGHAEHMAWGAEGMAQLSSPAQLLLLSRCVGPSVRITQLLCLPKLFASINQKAQKPA